MNKLGAETQGEPKAATLADLVALLDAPGHVL